MVRLELLATYMPIDQILEDNDVNPLVILKYLEKEGLIDIDQYFPNNEEEYDE